MNEDRENEMIDSIAKREGFTALAEEYVKFCADSGSRLPNISGFFRWLRFGAGALDHFKSQHADAHRTVMMIFEDEAINSLRPPSLVAAYMKQFFKADADAPQKTESICGAINLVFDHDVSLDGE